MNYISTRGGIDPVGFADAVMTGLAPDGGLLIPDSIPDVADRLSAWSKLSYQDLAIEIMKLYADLPAKNLKDLVSRSYATFSNPAIAPVVKVGDSYVLELFHGPTLSFKDIALQFLGNLFEYILKRRGGEMNILAATSGDTGSAAIYGVKGRKGVRIFVMHPKGRVSRSQKLQMTTVPDKNVFNLAVEGTFDDCQRIMKEIFGNLDFKKHYSLGSVNSINWARVLAQIVYYFYAAFRVMDQAGAEKARFTVPTGNFGDILAGWFACRMGLPIGMLVLATNENDILSRFFKTGDYSLGKVVKTVSPAMDIQVASNFERYLYYRSGCDAELVKSLMNQFARTGKLNVKPLQDGRVDSVIVAGAGTTVDTMAAIRSAWKTHGYLADPHTAVGLSVGSRYVDKAEPMVFVSTAHPAKFSEAITKATGKNLARHPAIDALEGLKERCKTVPARTESVRRYIEEVMG